MPISRTATLLASTAITFAFPFAAKAAVETCTNTAGVQSETTDFGFNGLTATILPADTFLVCGDWDGGGFDGRDSDYITFSDLNAGKSYFDISYSAQGDGNFWALFVGSSPIAGSLFPLALVDEGGFPDSGSLTIDTGDAFGGGSYTLALSMDLFISGIEDARTPGSFTYSIRLREAPPVNPIPLPASALLLGAGLAGLGVAGARKKAKRRG